MKARTCSSFTPTNASTAASVNRNAPAEAIVPDSDENAAAWQDINKDYAGKWPNITAKGPTPPDADEWKDKPDKKHMLRPESRK